MSFTMPAQAQELADSQAGVISRQQALNCGISADTIGRNVRLGRWQMLHRGIYTLYTGEPGRQSRLWAAVLSAGTDAALSHQTAAELGGLSDRRTCPIHVTIPESRRIKPVRGLVVHRSSRIVAAVHPALRPPRTRIEETALDLVDAATDFDGAFGVMAAACQRRLTTPRLLTEAMERRHRVRWRSELTSALGLVDLGVHSPLEYRYVRLVERPHGLPTATRQAKLSDGGRSRYLDNLYDDFHLCVELDGQSAHPEEQRWPDLHRINGITVQGIATLRYGWRDVSHRPCQVAAEIAAVLRSRGWPGPARRCRQDCTLIADR
jgi:putative AbiEi antitoxin of type IV toxin-antitoxin system